MFQQNPRTWFWGLCFLKTKSEANLIPKTVFEKVLFHNTRKPKGPKSLNLLVENVTSLSELFFTFFSESLRRVVRNNWKMLIKLIETAALWFAHFARPILSQNHVLDLDGKDVQFQTRVLDIKIWRRKSVTFLTSNLMSSETMFRSLEIWPRKSITFFDGPFREPPKYRFGRPNHEVWPRNLDSEVKTMVLTKTRGLTSETSFRSGFELKTAPNPTFCQKSEVSLVIAPSFPHFWKAEENFDKFRCFFGARPYSLSCFEPKTAPKRGFLDPKFACKFRCFWPQKSEVF